MNLLALFTRGVGLKPGLVSVLNFAKHLLITLQLYAIVRYAAAIKGLRLVRHADWPNKQSYCVYLLKAAKAARANS